MAEAVTQAAGAATRDGDGLSRIAYRIRGAIDIDPVRPCIANPPSRLDVNHGYRYREDNPDPALQFRSEGEVGWQRSTAALSACGGRTDLGPIRRGALRALYGLCSASSRDRRNGARVDLRGREPVGSRFDL